MKNLLKCVLTLSIGLASCQQENVVAPEAPAEVSAANLREGLLPTIPKKHQLVKHGESTLTYMPDGRLQKVTYVQATRGGGSPTYIQYKYGNNSIVSTLYYNNKIAEIATYLLDAKGRCYDAKLVEHIQYGPNSYVEKETGFTYLYNEKGQIKSFTDKKYASQKTTFDYNAAEELTKITAYNPSASNPGLGIVSESTLYYDQPTGDPILDDLSPINLEAANLPDPYLMIFGKPGKHLVKMITEKGSLGGKYFTYTLDAEGYVTKRDIYQVSGAALVESKSYGYLVTDLLLNL